MRFATISRGHDTVAVVVEDDQLFPIEGRSVLDLVRGGLTSALVIGRRAVASATPIPLAGAHLVSPIQPVTIRDFVTFEEHVEGVRASVQNQAGVPDAWYEAPHFYFTNPHTITGPDAHIAAPHGCTDLDFELEVAVVLGRGGSNLTVEEAAGAIFGYTILNDWSARDLQRREMEVGLGPAKGKDFANTLGPVLVTADEFAASHDADGFLTLGCTAHINGVEIGRDVLSNMGWTFPTLVAYASRSSRVEAGDVLGSGTTGNGGCLAELWGRRGRQDPPSLRPGDVVRLTVEGIGTLTNTVASRPDAPAPVPPVRRRDDRNAERARHLGTGSPV
ncbi:fumarylacetoacetate hydrolase family protein [Aldersonia sp. NBC_00410]|uniref:fumarylacetoacetate hydrolase family protein n=1 Tax=Aldersonia sp. NBC_00410 TaxID=2975954 RepID=UPI00224D604B|nr:fumarylacetoacetate hydrolase family protein [Aldersonia sp. NBC_00410]MCX5046349.1 fumarylacetoacetate hydrolase family protein [Aldersonia sp. NBC_00410]